jgi:hypothetical protein
MDISIIVTICVFVLALVVVIIQVVNGKWEMLKAEAVAGIFYAEKIIVGTKRGRDKMNFVIDVLYKNYVPAWMKIFVTKQMLEDLIEDSFFKVRDLLDDGKSNNSCEKIEPG